MDDELNTSVYIKLLEYRRKILKYDEKELLTYNYYLEQVIALLTKAAPSI